MTQTDNATADTLAKSPVARLASVLLILATLYICYFHNLGAIGLVGPDEPRYAWIARSMVESGDWVTPRLYGQPWFEKPVLYYWGAALSFKLFGVSEAAARFPSAIAALLATLAMAWFAWRAYGADTARWLLLLLPTTVGMIGFAHAAATDMPFAGMLTIAMVFAARLLGIVPKSSHSFTSSTSFNSCGLGFFLGLAVLAKGPAAIVLSGGAILLWVAFTKRWRDALRCLHLLAIGSFCLTALPWYILCAHRNPTFFRVFIIEHNFKRYLTPEFQHIQPCWFYIPIILVALFPWTALLIPAAQKSSEQNEPSQRPLRLFLISWPVFALVFFSISKSKLPGYILPAVPPVVLWGTTWLSSAVKRGERSLRWVAIVLGSCLIAMGFVFRATSDRLPAYTDIVQSPMALSITLLLVLAGILVALLGLFRRSQTAFIAMVISLLLVVITVDSFVQKLDRGLTARTALLGARRQWPEFTIQKASTWRLKRSLQYQLNFYANSEVPEWQPDGAKPAWLFVDRGEQTAAEQLGFECPLYLIYPAVIPCQAKPSRGGLGSLGGLTGNDSGRSADWQSR